MVRSVRGFIVIIVLVVLSLARAPSARAIPSFVVNNTGDGVDAAPGNSVCQTSTVGVCTLRAAIMEANAFAGADTIQFSLGAGFPTIQPLSSLPAIATEITIDGNTGGATKVELDGQLAPVNTVGLFITAPSGTVYIEHLIINRFKNDGIQINADATVDIGSNYIGTDTTGTVDLGNAGAGVNVNHGGTIAIGLALADQRNIISGNDGAGVLVGASTTNVILRNNYIGTDVSGTTALGNSGSGVAAYYPASIGTLSPGDGNVISGNAVYGVSLAPATTGTTVYGNSIGTNAAGTAALGNGAGGIGDAASVTTDIRGNVVSGNFGPGINLTGASASYLEGNKIGTQADGTSALGNAGDGVLLQNGSSGTLIDSGSAGTSVIAFNGGRGIFAQGIGSGNDFTGASIHDNGGLGIDLSPAGVTANDAGDGDSGPNGLQNFPVISAAKTNGSITTIQASLNSTASTYFVVEFFSSPSCDPSGNGEGQTPLTGATLATNASGNIGTFSVWGPPVPVGSAITGIASSTVNSDTSEFSACFTVAACAGADTDCDLFNDTAPTTVHEGPANTNTAVDNCPGLWNADQKNSDGNFIDLPSLYPFDDKTWPNSDAQGDACDTDDDNDGLTDTFEAGVGPGGPYHGICPAATANTDPLRRDSDGDEVLDGAECALGSDPMNSASKPAFPSAADDPDNDRLSTLFEIYVSATNPNVADTDGDGLKDGIEYKAYNSSGWSANTDGDLCPDIKEVTNVDGNTATNGNDLATVAGEFNLAIPKATADFDVDKNGVINGSDLALIASKVPSTCP